MFKTPKLLLLQKKAHIAYRCLDHNRDHPREYSGQQRSGKWHQLEDVLSAFDPDAGKEGDEYCQLFCVNSSATTSTNWQS